MSDCMSGIAAPLWTFAPISGRDPVSELLLMLIGGIHSYTDHAFIVRCHGQSNSIRVERLRFSHGVSAPRIHHATGTLGGYVYLPRCGKMILASNLSDGTALQSEVCGLI
jgi:hypothetical protein